MLKTAQLLILFLAITSCERAVMSETTTIVLQLPSTAASQINQNSLLIKSLDVVNSFNTTSSDQYLDILPTGFDSAGLAPINCYLVTVTGPEDFMNVNYCGNDDGNGEISKDYTFGTYVGYISPNSEISLEVPTGKNRKVRLFGFHVSDSSQCKDVRAGPLKNAMSFPYFVGKSDLINLSGTAQEVLVNLVNPSTLSRLDACKINVINPTITEADSSVLNTSFFPYGGLRVPTTMTHTCEQINISLFNQGTSFNPAGLLFSTSYNLESTTDGTNFVARPIYSTYERCNLNVSSQVVFNIPAINTSRAVWSRFLPGDSNITGLRIKPTANLSFTAVNTSVVASTAPETTYKFDLLGMPSLLLNGTCYPFKLAIRNFYGEHPATIAAGQYTVQSIINSTNVGQIYSEATCTASMATVSFTANQAVSGQLYFKVEQASPTTETGQFSITKSTGDANLLDTEIPFKVSHTQPPVNVKLSRVRSTGMPVVVINPVVNRCIPVTVNFRDNNNLPFKLTATGTLELLLNDANALVSDLAFYTNADCATGLINSPIALTLNSNYYTFYMSVSSLATAGPRNLVYKVNNLITSKYYFSIIDN